MGSLLLVAVDSFAFAGRPVDLAGVDFQLLRKFPRARTVEGDRLANERFEGGRVNFFSVVDVDRAAYVSVETRVEETRRILQRRAFGEGKLHDILTYRIRRCR
jgi:hypothetical protein